MARRYHALTYAVITVATALTPSAAFAAGNAAESSAPVSASVHPLPLANHATASVTSDTSELKRFTSAQSNSIRLRGRSTSAITHAAAAGTTIYVASSETTGCAQETGTGTSANPYCSLQDAVNAASSGDTISVSFPLSYPLVGSVTIGVSNLTIAAAQGTSGTLVAARSIEGDFVGKPAIIVDGASNVKISGFGIEAYNSPALEIVGSSAVTVDSATVYDSALVAGADASAAAVAIDGSSSNVTVSRSSISGDVRAVSVATGAAAIDLASNVFAPATASEVAADGVQGLDVAGNTMERGCGGAVAVTGSSTGVSLENNVLEDENVTTNPLPSSENSWVADCSARGYSWSPDISVDATAASSATSDYNDFYSYGSDDTPAYLWSGTTYTTPAAFRVATGEGAHDTVDPKQFTLFPPAGAFTVDDLPVEGSAAIGSANLAAPGQLSTDFLNHSPYTSRGAVQYNSDNQSLAVGLSAQDTSAYGISLTSSITTTQFIDVYIDWGDGSTETTTTCNATCSVPASHPYTKPGSYQITVTASDLHEDSVYNTVQVTTAGSDYTAYGPARLLDTRKGTGGASQPLTSTAPIKLKIAGNGSIPANVVAVAMNVTLTNTTGGGNVAVNPDGLPPSGTSNLNYSAGQTVANLVIVPVGKDGYVSFTKQGTGAVALIADVAGYYTQSAASGYTTSSPTRILDTRNGTGGASKPLTSTTPIKLKIAGNGSIPANVTAVAVNLTLTNSSGFGNVIAYPDGASQPTASNLNYGAGQTVANAAIVPVTDGYIDLAKQGPGSVAMIVDVEGYFSPTGTGAYVPTTPTRLFDSRTIKNGKLPAGFSYNLPIDQDSSGAVLPGITALVLNSTVTNVIGGGFLTVFPDNTNGTNGEPLVPNASNLNFGAGATVPNLTFATPGSNGVVDFYNGARASSLDLIVDIFGYYQNN